MEKARSRDEKLLREGRVPYLAVPEREALARLLARLEEECGDRIRRVILFGSRARGDADEESDLDLLIVTADGEEQVKAVTRQFGGDEDLYGTTLIFSEDEYREWQRLRMPLYVNVRRDGVELWDEAAWNAEERDFPLDFKEGEFRPMDETTKETIRLYVEEANRFWAMMEELRAAGYPDGAVGRAYYAAFYLVNAALYAVNVVRGKHHTVLGAVSQFLVKPGLIEKEYADIYKALVEGREWVDYRPFKQLAGKKPLSEAEMQQLLADTERLIARLKQFLHQRGALEE
ncbi:MAG TPA: HEPN domain-containing protein [Anaerolineae bacterium]|nr:HEPN domain-containing protein [Anaerolineae bacterium]